MKIMKLISIALSALLVSYIASAQRSSLSPIKLDIQPQPIDKSVGAWSEQTGYQVLIPIESEASRRIGPALKGIFSPEKALDVILADTDLKYQFVNKNTVAIRTANSPSQSASRYAHADNASTRTQPDSEGGGSTQSNSSGREPLAQVVVTAQKREERLQDVPVPVTVIASDVLLGTNKMRVQDYYTSVPGLSVQEGQQQGAQLLIRGLSTGAFAANPSVGVVVDDVPYGASTLWGGGAMVPDVDPGDLARIEVLRGPQGTLYGTSSLGGLLKFVTVDPSTDRLSGRMEVGGNTFKNADQAGYSVRGSINIPLSDTFAIRASAFTRMDPGYVDNVLLDQKGVNEVKNKGGRLSALWRISDAVTVKVTGTVQKPEAEGSSFVSPGLGDLEQQKIAGTGPLNRDIKAATGTVTANLGRFELTSLTGYNVNEVKGIEDASAPPFIYLKYFNFSKADKFSQEFRLGTKLGEHIDWQAGLFYTKEETIGAEWLDVTDPITGALQRHLLDRVSADASYKEYAAFTNLTFKFTDRFDVQLGGRQAHYTQEFQQVWTGLLESDGGVIADSLGSPYVPPHISPRDSKFTYLLTPRLRVSSDWMVYARFASGYRTGGPNSRFPSASLEDAVLPIMKPDTTKNYEIGVKGGFLDQTVTVDASVYYIDWSDIQLFTQTILPNQVAAAVYVNGDSAKSQGLELSLEARPWNGLKANLWAAWNDAKLTANFGPDILTEGRSGDRLPLSPRFSAYVSLEQQIPLGETWSGYASGSLSYVGERKDVFVARDSGLSRAVLPSYVRTDLNVGARHDTWNVGLYFNNVFDRRGIVTRHPDTGYVQVLQPRSIGMILSRTFE